MSLRYVIAAIAVFATACGGGGSGGPASPPTVPTPTVPISSACGAVTQSVSSSTAIVNGADCSTDTTSVVLLNMKDASGQQAGSCSGTVISPRAILTAAHCLQSPAASVQVFLGSGPQIPASSFAAHPAWRSSSTPPYDIGIVVLPVDISRTPKPLLLSRAARVGETAVISGWGKDSGSGVTATLRAGVATLIDVTPLTLLTTSTATASSTCQGDSGGPILVQEGDAWAVTGVISANSTLACSFGDNIYAAVRAPDAMAFILDRVPDAARR